jgi:hypothetical protein
VPIQNSGKRSFGPKNEQGVFYLFSRNHERLGFKQIIKINQNETPDIVAINDTGKKIGIELEYESRRVFEHYRVLSKRDQNRTENRRWPWDAQTKKYVSGEWKKVVSGWNFVYKGETLLQINEDYPNQYWHHKPTGTLLRRTVKEKGIDIIMYWIKNEKPEDFKFWEFDKEVKPCNLRESTTLRLK